MTLEQLSFLAQIVGAVGVLASLIFVGLQIRQNTQSQHVERAKFFRRLFRKAYIIA